MKQKNQHKVHQIATAYLLHAMVYAVVIGLGFYFEYLKFHNVIDRIVNRKNPDFIPLYNQAEIYYYSCLAVAVLISVAVIWYHASKSVATGNLFFFCFTVLFGLYAYVLFFTWGDIRLDKSRWWIAGGCLIQIAFSCVEYIKWNKADTGRLNSDILDNNNTL